MVVFLELTIYGEYVLIGTFVRFTVAILLGLIMIRLIA